MISIGYLSFMNFYIDICIVYIDYVVGNKENHSTKM